ncbi:MAG TPA: hypothetical protein VMZ30_11565 [Pyrinomonadaceae bacterium]|nr:hypothetical protein [Pyrinomonadaceae bacterium]
MKAKYTRLFSDENGESHFEERECELDLIDFAPPASPLAVSESFPASDAAFLAGPSGWIGDWHISPSRNLFVVISGEWEVEASDGTTRLFLPNSVLLVEDISGKGHRSRVVSKEDSFALLVRLTDENTG